MIFSYFFMNFHDFHKPETRQSENPQIRKSGIPEILARRAWRSLIRNPQPHILQSTFLLGGRHEPEALKPGLAGERKAELEVGSLEASEISGIGDWITRSR